MIRKFRYVPSALFFILIAWIIYEADKGIDNPLIKLGEKIPLGDKIGHFMIYGLLALLLNFTLSNHKLTIRRVTVYTSIVIVLSFAILEEITQIAFASRTFDLIDILFDVLGVIFFMFLSNAILMIYTLPTKQKQLLWKKLKRGIL